LYTAGISWYVAISAGFKWSGAVVRLIMLSLASGAFVLFTAALLPPHYQSVVGTLVATVVLIACLKGLSFRLGADHPFNKIIDPIARFVRLGSFR